MNPLTPCLTADRAYDEVLPWLKQRLSQAGLRVIQTFDLAAARVEAADCPCPHHGTEKCDCQMIILLVYGRSAEPATLMLHGNHRQTWLALVNTAEQPVDPRMQSAIERAIQLPLT